MGLQLKQVSRIGLTVTVVQLFFIPISVSTSQDDISRTDGTSNNPPECGGTPVLHFTLATKTWDCIAGGVAGALAPITAAGSAALTGLAIAGAWAAVAAPVFILLSKIFHGADPRQVPASRIEQVFELAAVNMHSLVENAFLIPQEVIEACKVLLQKGVEYYAQMSPQLGKAGEKGAANMGKVVNAEIAAIAALRAPPLKPLVLSEARNSYKSAQGWARPPGWYAESIKVADELTDSYLQSIPRLQTAAAVPAAGAVAPASSAAADATMATAAKAANSRGPVAAGLAAVLRWLFLANRGGRGLAL